MMDGFILSVFNDGETAADTRRVPVCAACRRRDPWGRQLASYFLGARAAKIEACRHPSHPAAADPKLARSRAVVEAAQSRKST